MYHRVGSHAIKRALLAAALLSLLSPEQRPHAETTPLHVITSTMKKPEILLVLDTSGSMHFHPGGGSSSTPSVGADCNQDSLNIVDLPQDGVCSGLETSSNSPADCTITDNASAAPGSAPACYRQGGPPTSGASRMLSIKRVLRGLLPELRASANFGLVTFSQSGYYQYFKAASSCGCGGRCRQVVSCTAGLCPSASGCPSGYSPSWNGSSCECTRYKKTSSTAPTCELVSDAQCSDPNDCSSCRCSTIPRSCQKIGAPPCCSCPAGSKLTCTNDFDCTSCRCQLQDYRPADCCSCSHLGAGWDLSDRCYELGTPNRKCRCRKPKGAVWGSHSEYKWKTAQCTCPPPAPAPSCDPSCSSLAPIFTAPAPACTGTAQKPVSIFLTETEQKALGLWVNDAPTGACNPATENCGWRDRNATPASWTGTKLTLLSQTPTSSAISSSSRVKDSLYRCTADGTKENRWGFSSVGRSHSSSFNGCSSWEYVGSYYTYQQKSLESPSTSCSFPNCQVVDDYRGPQFTDADGEVWVFRRIGAGDWSNQGEAITGPGMGSPRTGMMVVPIDASSEQEFQDRVVYEIMQRVNSAKDGGIYPLGGTPTSSAIKLAGDHFLARQNGTAPFATDQQDYAAACRKRFVVVLTDGQSNTSDDVSQSPAEVARRLYLGGRLSNNYNGWNQLGVYAGRADNPIRTLAVGLPGLDSYAELNDIADQGADGTKNSTPKAYAPTNETELTRDVRAAIMQAVSGDYVTTGLGVANTLTSVGTMAVLASTRFPEWEGQLRAFDLTAPGGPALSWDAGQQLYSANPDVGYDTRAIYTGYPTINSGTPIPIFSSGGTINLSAVLAAVSASGKTMPGTAAQQQDMLRWIAGKGRRWRLSPIFNSVPATVGAEPPDYSGLTVTNREPLIYVTSHDGLLHAFRARDGSEAFAYVPPNLLPRIFELWASSTSPQRQDEDPESFRWILGSSPRVQDVPDCTSGTCLWRTNLVLTMGASDNAFAVLDITNPVQCTTTSCSPTAEFFRVIGHSHVSGASLEDKLGETWSVPAMFFGTSGASKLGNMAMGSGYPPLPSGPANQGDYYFHFSPLLPVLGSGYSVFDPPALHAAGAAVVDYAVIADTAATVDENLIGVATYQADLLGRIVKYPGGAAPGLNVIDDGGAHPFYFSPAVYYDSTASYLVAASGSANELQQGTSVESKVYIYKNDAELLSFRVADLCALFPEAAPTCPSDRARPVSSPLVVRNNPGNAPERMEAFLALYEPPPDNDPCALGESYVYRLQIDTATSPAARLLQVHHYSGRAAGLTLVGGGVDVAMGISGSGSQRATVVALGGQPLGSGPTPGPSEVMVESWREVP